MVLTTDHKNSVAEIFNFDDLCTCTDTHWTVLGGLFSLVNPIAAIARCDVFVELPLAKNI